MMRLSVPFLIALLLSTVTVRTSVAAEASLVEYSGEKIVRVELEGAQIPSRELGALLPLSAGEPLDPVRVRNGIMNLYRTGQFDSVEVFAGRVPEGVVIRFVAVPKRWLREVIFEGNLYIGDTDLLKNIDLSRREEITDKRLAQNAQRLEKYYAFRGFTGTEVSYRVEPAGGNQTQVIFRIREGVSGFISDLRVEGDEDRSRFRTARLIASMPGEDLDGKTIARDTEKIRRKLRERGYLSARVNHRLDADPDYPRGTILTFLIETGPRFNLQVMGRDSADVGRIEKWMRSSFLKAQTIEEAKEEVKNRVLGEYRRSGYPFATVSWDDDMVQARERTITLEFDPGMKVLVSGVQVHGAQRFSNPTIMETVGVRTGEPFIRVRLDDGMASLERLYRDDGYLDAEVSLVPLNFLPGETTQEVAVNLEVREGPRTVIRDLRVQSATLPSGGYIDLLGFREGDPYVPEKIETGRERILMDLEGRGYLYASVALAEPVRNDDGTVDLQVLVDEGPLVTLGSIVIAGNEHVDPRIIRLSMDLGGGEVLTREKILKAQERIYRLGVLSSVDIGLADPQKVEDTKDLIVTVRERPRYVLGFRLGYGSEDRLRGEVSVTNRNLAGMARSLTLTGKGSAIQRGTSLLYNHPWFTSRPVNLSASISDLVEERDSYSRDALSVSLDLTRSLSDRTEVSLGYVFEGLRLFDVAEGAQLSPDDEGKTDIAALVGELIYDSRSDFLDPWSGTLGDIRIEVAHQYLGSKADYYKVELASHRYLEVGGDVILAWLLRMGVVNPYSRSEEVIISKRFFLGGQNSVRGYALDTLGPRDVTDGSPKGGNYMLNANLELRYPLFWSLRGVLFVDSGSVWLRKGDPGFELRASSGAGLRWTSPIGPLSLDYGYKLNPVPEDEKDRYRWHFSIGHAF